MSRIRSSISLLLFILLLGWAQAAMAAFTIDDITVETPIDGAIFYTTEVTAHITVDWSGGTGGTRNVTAYVGAAAHTHTSYNFSTSSGTHSFDITVSCVGGLNQTVHADVDGSGSKDSTDFYTAQKINIKWADVSNCTVTSPANGANLYATANNVVCSVTYDTNGVAGVTAEVYAYIGTHEAHITHTFSGTSGTDSGITIPVNCVTGVNQYVKVLCNGTYSNATAVKINIYPVTDCQVFSPTTGSTFYTQEITVQARVTVFEACTRSVTALVGAKSGVVSHVFAGAGTETFPILVSACAAGTAQAVKVTVDGLDSTVLHAPAPTINIYTVAPTSVTINSPTNNAILYTTEIIVTCEVDSPGPFLDATAEVFATVGTKSGSTVCVFTSGHQIATVEVHNCLTGPSQTVSATCKGVSATTKKITIYAVTDFKILKPDNGYLARSSEVILTTEITINAPDTVTVEAHVGTKTAYASRTFGAAGTYTFPVTVEGCVDGTSRAFYASAEAFLDDEGWTMDIDGTPPEVQSIEITYLDPDENTVVTILNSPYATNNLVGPVGKDPTMEIRISFKDALHHDATESDYLCDLGTLTTAPQGMPLEGPTGGWYEKYWYPVNIPANKIVNQRVTINVPDDYAGADPQHIYTTVFFTLMVNSTAKGVNHIDVTSPTDGYKTRSTEVTVNGSVTVDRAATYEVIAYVGSSSGKISQHFDIGVDAVSIPVHCTDGNSQEVKISAGGHDSATDNPMEWQPHVGIDSLAPVISSIEVRCMGKRWQITSPYLSGNSVGPVAATGTMEIRVRFRDDNTDETSTGYICDLGSLTIAPTSQTDQEADSIVRSWYPISIDPGRSSPQAVIITVSDYIPGIKPERLSSSATFTLQVDSISPVVDSITIYNDDWGWDNQSMRSWPLTTPTTPAYLKGKNSPPYAPNGGSHFRIQVSFTEDNISLDQNDYYLDLQNIIVNATHEAAVVPPTVASTKGTIMFDNNFQVDTVGVAAGKTITLYITDKAGNVLEKSYYNIMIDDTVPDFNCLVFSNTTKSLSFDTSELAASQWPAIYLPAGDNFQVTFYYDDAGNQSAMTDSDIILDLGNIGSDSSSPNTISSDYMATFTNKKVSVGSPDANNGRILVRLMDAAGNHTVTPYSSTCVTIDTTPPVINDVVVTPELIGLTAKAIIDAKNPTIVVDSGSYFKKNTTFEVCVNYIEKNSYLYASPKIGPAPSYDSFFNLSSSMGNKTVEVLASDPVSQKCNATFEVKGGLPADGDYELTSTVTDRAGNQCESTFVIHVDSVKPKMTFMPTYFFNHLDGSLQKDQSPNPNPVTYLSGQDPIPMYTGFTLNFDEPVFIGSGTQTNAAPVLPSISASNLFDFLKQDDVLISSEKVESKDPNPINLFSATWKVGDTSFYGSSVEVFDYFSAGPSYLDPNAHYTLGGVVSGTIIDRAGNVIDSDSLTATMFTALTEPTVEAIVEENGVNYTEKNGVYTNTSGQTKQFFNPDINVKFLFSERMDKTGELNSLWISLYNNGGYQWYQLTTTAETVPGIGGPPLDNSYYMQDQSNDGKTIVVLDFNNNLFKIGGVCSIMLAGKNKQTNLADVPYAGPNSYNDGGPEASDHPTVLPGIVSLAGTSIFSRSFTFNVIKDVPHVLTTDPLANQTGVDRTTEVPVNYASTEITIFFDSPLDSHSVETKWGCNSVRLFKCSHEVSLDNEVLGTVEYQYVPNGFLSPYRVVFHPASYLAFNSDYTFSYSHAIRNLNGVPLSSSPDYSGEASLVSFRTVSATFSDTTRPTITSETSISPQHNSVEVNTNSAIYIDFSKVMDAASLRTAVIVKDSAENEVIGQLNYQDPAVRPGAAHELSFIPTGGFKNTEIYSVEVNSNAKDIWGNSFDRYLNTPALEPLVFKFATPGAAPWVISTNPSNGTTEVNRTKEVVSFTFSHDMDPTSVSQGLQVAIFYGGSLEPLKTSQLNWPAVPAKTFTLEVENPLPYDTTIYLIALNNCRSAQGSRMKYNPTFSATFETESEGTHDITRPTWDGDLVPQAQSRTTPYPGSTEVAIASSVEIAFNKSMNEASLSPSFHLIDSEGNMVSGSLVYTDSPNHLLSFKPSYSFQEAEQYTVELMSYKSPESIGYAIDLSGNSFDALLTTETMETLTYAFNTHGSKPKVQSTIPADGANNVSNNIATVEIVFDHMMDTATVINSIRAFYDSQEIQGYVDYTASPTNDFMFHFLNPLPYNKNISIRVMRNCCSTSETRMKDDAVITFTTENNPVSDTVSPTWISRIDLTHTPKWYSETSPSINSIEVAVTSEIHIFFTESMDEASVYRAFHLYDPNTQEVGGTKLYLDSSENSSTHELIFRPYENLAELVSYKIQFDSVANDLSGNQFDAYITTEVAKDNLVYNFTTGSTLPHVISTWPADGAIDVSHLNLFNRTQTIEIRFSEPMNPDVTKTFIGAQLQYQTDVWQFVTAEVTWNAAKDIFYLHPKNPLPYKDTVRMIVSRSCESDDGEKMPDKYWFSFTTESTAETQIPTWVSSRTIPSMDSTEVSLTDPIKIFFNTSMHEAKLYMAAYLQDYDGHVVAGDKAYLDSGENSSTHELIFTPYVPLNPLARYTFHIDTNPGAEDLNTDNFTSNEAFSGNAAIPLTLNFTTSSPLPHVVSTLPAAGAINVTNEITVEINFSQSMETSTVKNNISAQLQDGNGIWQNLSSEVKWLPSTLTNAKKFYLQLKNPVHYESLVQISISQNCRSITPDLIRMPADYVFTFTTEKSSDNAIPTWVSKADPAHNPPWYSETYPYQITEEIPINSSIRIFFTKSMNEASLYSSFTLQEQDGPGVAGSIAYLDSGESSSTHELIFTPSIDLKANTVYVYTLYTNPGAGDLNGNFFDANRNTDQYDRLQNSFTTGANRPVVISTVPADGAINVSHLLRTVEVNFSQPMDTESVAAGIYASCDSQRLQSAVRVATTTKFYLLFTNPLPYNKPITVTVLKSCLRDTNELGMSSDYAFTFNTGTSSDITIPTWISSVNLAHYPPWYTATSPYQITEEIPVTAEIHVFFTKSMNEASLYNAFTLRELNSTEGTQESYGPEVAGTMTYLDSGESSSTHELIFTPTLDLKPDTAFIFIVNTNPGAEDLSGNFFDSNRNTSKYDPLQISFITGAARPLVLSTIPADGATNISHLLQTVEVNFSQPMDVASVAAGLYAVADDQHLQATVIAATTAPVTKFYLLLNNPLPYGKPITVTVMATCQRADGEVRQDTDFLFTFITETASGSDTVKPTWDTVLSSPLDGSVEVSPDANIYIYFTKPMDEGSLYKAFHLLDKDSNEITGTLAYRGSGGAHSNELVFNPSYDMTAGVKYQVIIENTAKDLSGNLFDGIPKTVPADGLSLVFYTTGVSPWVLKTIPTDGAINVSHLLGTIEVDFSHPMDPASISTGLNAKELMPVILPGTTKETIIENSLACNLTWSGDFKNFYLLPRNPLPYNSTIELSIGSSCTNSSGNRLLQDYSYHFKIEAYTIPDTLTPTWVRDYTTPSPDSVDVALSSDIVLYFNKTMDEGSVYYGFSLLDSQENQVGGTKTYLDTAGAHPHQLTFHPSNTLQPGEQYKVQVATGAKDLYGNNFDGYTNTIKLDTLTYYFYTLGTLPVVKVISTSPSSGATNVRYTLDSIEIVFNHNMDAARVLTGITASMLTANASGTGEVLARLNTSVTYNPSDLTKFYLNLVNPLPFNKDIYVKVANSCRDVSGIPLISDYPFSFKTENLPDPDQMPPTVNGVYPQNGSLNVSLNSKILIYFSESVDETTVNSSTISLTNQSNVPINAFYHYFDQYSSGLHVAELTPIVPLGGTQTYKVTINEDGVKDLAGNGFDGDLSSTPLDEYIFSFQTTSQNFPYVVSVAPANEETNVSSSEVIVVTFSKAMDMTVTGNSFSLVSNTGEVITGQKTWNTSQTVLTFDPDTGELITNFYYTVVVGSSSKDTLGNTMQSMFTSRFQTGTPVVTTVYPQVVLTIPDNYLNTVPTSLTEIIVQFTNTMEVDSLNTAGTSSVMFTNSSGTIIPISINEPVDTKEIRITILTTPLAENETYNLKIMATVYDVNGHKLDSDGDGLPNLSYEYYRLQFKTVGGVTAAGLSHTIPPSRASNVSIDTSIQAFFTSDNGIGHIIKLYKGSLSGPEISPKSPLSYIGTLRLEKFIPPTLEYSTRYYFTVDGGSSISSGDPYNDGPLYFTTESDNQPPVVETVTPVENATSIPLTQEISIKFSEAMDQDSISEDTITLTNGSRLIPVQNFSYDPDTVTAAFSPFPSLVNGIRYTVTVKASCKDLAGNSMSDDYSYNFTTAANCANHVLEAFPLPGDGTTLMIYLKKPTAYLSSPHQLVIWQTGMSTSEVVPTVQLTGSSSNIFKGAYHLKSSYPGLGMIKMTDSGRTVSMYFVYEMSSFKTGSLASPDKQALLSYLTEEQAAIVCFQDSPLNTPASGAPYEGELVQTGSAYSFYFPAAKPGVLKIEASDSPRSGIYYFANERWNFLGRNYAGGSFSAPASQSGKYGLFEDTKAPRLLTEAKPEYKEKINEIVLKVAEYGSGIDERSSEVTLDGKPQVIRYDAAAGELTVRFGEFLGNGDYQLQFKLADKAGNQNQLAPTRFAVNLPFSLNTFQVFPNPATDFLAVRYSLSGTPESAKLIIYDSSGKKVKTLDLSGSNGMEQFDLVGRKGNPLANGVYFYRFEAVRDGVRLKFEGKFSILK
ncbi:MAG: Ig-like domain-containing protein [Candidatus Wallbacteria bacterium]|nr:Ig-like domain-containing protein [Candidatus Wallbacteria bacterium]